MNSHSMFFAVVAFVLLVGYLVLAVASAVSTYRADKWARGNWALRLWWRWFSGTPAARKRRMNTIAEIGVLLLIVGIPLSWVVGFFFAWQAGKLQEYLDWTGKTFEFLGKLAQSMKK